VHSKVDAEVCPGYKYKDAVMSFICIGLIPGFECKQLGGFRNLSAGKQPRTSYSGNLVQRDNYATASSQAKFGENVLLTKLDRGCNTDVLFCDVIANHIPVRCFATTFEMGLWSGADGCSGAVDSAGRAGKQALSRRDRSSGFSRTRCATDL
jgi:hypothetical protein